MAEMGAPCSLICLARQDVQPLIATTKVRRCEDMQTITIVDPEEFAQLHNKICNGDGWHMVTADHYACDGKCGCNIFYDEEYWHFGIVPAEALYASQIPNSLQGRQRAIRCEENLLKANTDWFETMPIEWVVPEDCERYYEDMDDLAAIQYMREM
jgi:hypothetical protein